MLHAIEMETVISPDGKLPQEFHEAFGCKARVIVSLPETPEVADGDRGNSQRLMRFAGTVDWPFDDPVEWQRQERANWDRQWDR